MPEPLWRHFLQRLELCATLKALWSRQPPLIPPVSEQRQACCMKMRENQQDASLSSQNRGLRITEQLLKRQTEPRCLVKGPDSNLDATWVPSGAARILGWFLREQSSGSSPLPKTHFRLTAGGSQSSQVMWTWTAAPFGEIVLASVSHQILPT